MILSSLNLLVKRSFKGCQGIISVFSYEKRSINILAEPMSSVLFEGSADMVIPEFEGAPIPYWLPAGVHQCTYQQMRERFLWNDARCAVWGRFEYVLRRLGVLGFSVSEIYIDGSFVTARDNPGDVDAAVCYPPDKMIEILNLHSNAPEEYDDLMNHLDPEWLKKNYDFDFKICAYDEDFQINLNGFQRGFTAKGLPEPDEERDPPGLVVPDEKGILLVDVTDIFPGGSK